MDEFMNVDKMSKFRSGLDGCFAKDDLQSELLSSPIAKQIKVSFEDVLQVMLKLELCYEQEDENEDKTIMIPSVFPDGRGKLTWPSKTKPVNW